MKSFSSSLVAVFVALFGLSIAGQSYARDEGAQSKYQQGQRATNARPGSGDIKFQANKQIHKFVPGDIVATHPREKPCSESGENIAQIQTGYCYDYKNVNTSWRIRYLMVDGAADRVFKVDNSGNRRNWVAFDSNAQPRDISAEAQQFAGTHRQRERTNGDGVTQSPAVVDKCEGAYVVRYGARECSDQRKSGSGVVENPRKENPDIGSPLGIGKTLREILQQGR